MNENVIPMKKIFVSVKVVFDSDGVMTPRTVIWGDGRRFEIDRIVDVTYTDARRTGAPGQRYRIRIGGRESFLYFEKGTIAHPSSPGIWFVERK